MTTGLDGSIYTYDARNRLLTASKSGVSETFAYDRLNPQVSRWIDNGRKTYSAWDGWDLMQEYQEDQGAGVVTASYLYRPRELVTNNYYYQDGSGCLTPTFSFFRFVEEFFPHDSSLAVAGA